MTSFENIYDIELYSIIKIDSPAPADEEINETHGLAIVIDKDFIKNRLKVRLLKLKREFWLEPNTQFEPILNV